MRNALRRVSGRIELTDADLDFIPASLRTIPANFWNCKALEGLEALEERLFLHKFTYMRMPRKHSIKPRQLVGLFGSHLLGHAMVKLTTN